MHLQHLIQGRLLAMIVTDSQGPILVSGFPLFSALVPTIPMLWDGLGTLPMTSVAMHGMCFHLCFSPYFHHPQA